MTLSRVLAGVAIAAGLVFGFMAGEYSTVDWWKLRQAVGQQRDSIARLEEQIDSLNREVILLETDSATQERVARELFGMIRDGEILYKVEFVESGEQ